MLAGLILYPMAYAHGLPVLPVQNLFQECVAVTASAPYTVNGRVYIDADMRIIQPAGHCGCTSTAAAYSLLNTDGMTLLQARFDLIRSEKKKLHLGKAAEFSKQSDVSLRIGCAGPP
ncbi:DUF2195 family protein [Noviherbaspirillum aerium]|uniref:DUF2195 family protein n=1 Tax=Noviherbaspirillum aerium TaxID=2588497 RepID=UPI00178C7082|nr:DUF2195 family protein [Noviherbaspirillum aerium]